MRYRVLGLLFIATVIAYVQRLGLSAPTKIIETQFGFGPKEMGIVMAGWYWAYALMQLPTGWVADRLGSRVGLMLLTLGWTTLTALTGLATGFWGLLTAWVIMGGLQAGMFPCATKTVGTFFPKGEQAFASGALVAGMSLGSAISHWLSGRLLQAEFTWQTMLLLYALPGFVWLMLFPLVLPSWNDQAVAKTNQQPIKWRKLLTDPQMQIISAQQFFRASAMALFYTWLPRYLKETFNMTEQEAGNLAFWPPMVGMFGGFIGGYVSDWVYRVTGSFRLSRQGMAILSMLLCGLLGFAAYVIHDERVLIFLLCAIAFLAMGSNVSGYTVAIAYGGKRVATVFAMMNMSGNIGAGLFPLLIGWLVKVTNNWNLTLLVFAVLFLLSGLCWCLVNPRGTLFPEDDECQSPAS